MGRIYLFTRDKKTKKWDCSCKQSKEILFLDDEECFDCLDEDYLEIEIVKKEGRMVEIDVENEVLIKKSVNGFMELTEDQKKEHIKKLSPKELWHLVLAIGRKQEPESKGITNHFNRDDVTTIIANMEFFGATDIWMRQTIFDLMTPKFRLFDFLGMCIMSRNDDNRKQNNLPLKVLIWAYLKMNGVPEKFI